MAVLRLFEILGFIITVMLLLTWFFKALYGEWPWNYNSTKKDKEGTNTENTTDTTNTPQQ